MDEPKKDIDESWKETVEKEKEKLKNDKQFQPPQPDFSFFITTLSLQASISLGLLPNPATNKTEIDLAQSKFIIDTLAVLEEKTKGNLTEEETKLLENLLYDLRMSYIDKSKGGTVK
ncbi:MAG: DUF1844 domain-containing protein [Candidatus Omnitrophota bacterium]